MTEQRLWSFDDFVNDLRRTYGDPPAPGSVLLGLPERQKAHAIIREWREGVPTYAGLTIGEYLGSIRLPSTQWSTYVQHLPTTSDSLSKERRWIHLALHLTPPFQTDDAEAVRDLRPRQNQRSVGLPSQEYFMLTSRLSTALFIYEQAIQAYTQDPVSDLQSTLKGLSRAQIRLRWLHQHGRLPASLKGTRRRTMDAMLDQSQDYIRALLDIPDMRGSFLSATFVRESYTRLLHHMKQVFQAHIPRTQYPAQAIYHALAAILSPLLQRTGLPLAPGCTTPRAIEQRCVRQ